MSTYPTISRRPSEGRAISEFFSLHGLPPDSVDTLTEVSRLRRRPRGRPLVLPVAKSAFFLVDGRVSELVQPGKVRLWRELMLFESVSSTALLPGTYSEERANPNPKNLTSGSTLSRCVFVEVPNTKLNSLVMTDPAIALMLARMAAKRHLLTERMYTASRATPAARVAAVLNYLAEPTRRNAIKPREDGVMVMTTTEELVASGPSQADLADALCLGRATVEKAIAELRQVKALRSFGPGERANRCYPIEDRDLLRQIAVGG
ncbi:hypothetical protein ABZ027_31925 [Streptomyces sp. NPDC006332]|uniref:Crp/Fnr family transcriptional regulator n=1 Tax=Streptomyces sp. NPDC006332 TaxID=3155456 RepID=UPI0033B1381C